MLLVVLISHGRERRTLSRSCNEEEDNSLDLLHTIRIQTSAWRASTVMVVVVDLLRHMAEAAAACSPVQPTLLQYIDESCALMLPSRACGSPSKHHPIRSKLSTPSA